MLAMEKNLKSKTAPRYYNDPILPEEMVKVEDEWLGDETYKEMVQKSVILCTDVVLTMKNDVAIYLGKRVALPMAGVWCIGGRVFFNDETLEDSIARCIYLETGAKVEAERFEYIGTPHLYSWIKVAQGDFGGKNLSLTFKLEVSNEEMKEMSRGLQPKEYDSAFGLQRYTRERLVNEKVHQAMVDVFDDIFGEGA